jgi:hypothetical protein
MWVNLVGGCLHVSLAILRLLNSKTPARDLAMAGIAFISTVVNAYDWTATGSTSAAVFTLLWVTALALALYAARQQWQRADRSHR